MKDKLAGASALHAHEGDTHVVGVLALRVLLVADSNGWFAQGLDIDYAAGGASVDDAKKNFEDGFTATVREHLLMHGDIERLLKPAEQDAWAEFYASPKLAQSFSCVQLHKLKQLEASSRSKAKDFPFDSIAFLEPAAARSEMGRPVAA